MTRIEELNLIEDAIKNGKLRRISSEEGLNIFFNNMKTSSETQRQRTIRTNKSRGVGTRVKSKFKEII